MAMLYIEVLQGLVVGQGSIITALLCNWNLLHASMGAAQPQPLTAPPPPFKLAKMFWR